MIFQQIDSAFYIKLEYTWLIVIVSRVYVRNDFIDATRSTFVECVKIIHNSCESTESYKACWSTELIGIAVRSNSHEFGYISIFVGIHCLDRIIIIIRLRPIQYWSQQNNVIKLKTFN